MFPIRDHNPSGGTPYVTYALIAINVVIFAATWHLFSDQRALMGFFSDWALFPNRVSSGGGYSGLLTSMFLHGGVMHLAGNMLFLWIFGDNLEDEMGHLRFLAFYLASGVGAGLAQVLAAPYSGIPTVGASGAIAGVMGGYLLLYPKARIDILFIFFVFFRILAVPAWAMLGFWFALQVVNGSLDDGSAGGVAYWAHAGGFVVGVLLTLPVFLRQGGTAFWSRTHGQPPHPPAEYELTRTRIPRVRRKKR
jgi:membrane associated rhomboid family serine protease